MLMHTPTHHPHTKKNKLITKISRSSSMKPYITAAGIAVGYETPSFPSLAWHFNSEDLRAPFLYYTVDIWRFTVFWTMIIFAGFYAATGTAAAVCSRRVLPGVGIFASYILWGELQAVVSGCIVGSLLAATYKTGALTMSTWIPFVWALAQILYVIVSSHSVASFLR